MRKFKLIIVILALLLLFGGVWQIRREQQGRTGQAPLAATATAKKARMASLGNQAPGTTINWTFVTKASLTIFTDNTYTISKASGGIQSTLGVASGGYNVSWTSFASGDGTTSRVVSVTVPVGAALEDLVITIYGTGSFISPRDYFRETITVSNVGLQTPARPTGTYGQKQPRGQSAQARPTAGYGQLWPRQARIRP